MTIEKGRRDLIKQLHLKGLPVSRIARRLGISRNTAYKYLRIKEGEIEEVKYKTELKNNEAEIRKLFFEYDMNCSAMTRELPWILKKPVKERQLQSFCKQFREEYAVAKQIKTDRFETPPGDQMQIDFGTKPLLVGGNLIKVKIFVCVLGYSRRIFAKAYPIENQDAWFDGMESAFAFFGGVPHVIVSDNAKALVKNRQAKIPDRYNDNYSWFCNYHGVIPCATQIYKPYSKGKVESAVKYVKKNALVGRNSYSSIEEINAWLEEWSLSIADVRNLKGIVGAGKIKPIERWPIEKMELNMLIKPPIAKLRVEYRKVDKNGLIHIDSAAYRVPDYFSNTTVQVLIGKEISIFRTGKKPYVIDKAKDLFIPKQQSASTPLDKDAEYRKRLEIMKLDPEWKTLQNMSLQRETSKYDMLFKGEKEDA